MYRGKKKKQKIFLVKQKICGLFWIVIAIISYFTDKDATLALIAIPFGLYLIFTKRIVMDYTIIHCTKKVRKEKSSTVLVPLRIVNIDSTLIDSKMERYLERIDRILRNSY